MAGSLVGRPGQAFTGLGSWGRAQGAQSRFDPLPQAGTMGRQAARGAAAGAEEQAAQWKLWLDQQKRTERMGFYRGLAGLMREGALGISDAVARRKVEEAMKPKIAERAAPITEGFFGSPNLQRILGGGGIPEFGTSLGPPSETRTWQDELALLGRY